MRRFVFLLPVIGLLGSVGCQSLTPEQYAALPERQRELARLVQREPPEFPTELLTLKTRPMMLQKFLFIRPPAAVASVVLFAGLGGGLGLKAVDGAVTLRDGRFLIGNRLDFARRKLAVAIVETERTGGMSDGFRASDEFVTDIEAVLAFLKLETHLPTWLVGTSRGTISAAAVAIKSREPVAGLVLTSTIESVAGMKLDKITVPVLLVAHKDDTCPASPPRLDGLASRLVSSPRVEKKFYSGGLSMLGKSACSGRSAHGFNGIESEVTDAIADFITASSAGQTPRAK